MIDAAAWKGRVVLRTRREGDQVVLEVQDNGAGMTEEVRRRCVETHFTTKRDNAIYEGHSTGMGLGGDVITLNNCDLVWIDHVTVCFPPSQLPYLLCHSQGFNM